MFQSDDMDALGQVLRPPDDGPFAKPLYLAGPALLIELHGVSLQERVVGQLVKDTQQALAIGFFRGGERVQDRIVRRVGVRWDHLSSAFNRSWSCSNSSREWPEPARELLRRRASSRCQSGSSLVVRHRMYSANSRRCSGSKSSTAFF